MAKPNPFTPKSGWEPHVFVGREKEIEFFKKKLAEAIRGRCDHFLILGDWGIGKTALLKEFKKIAQENKYLTSLISIGQYKEGSPFIDGVKELIEQISLKLPINIAKLKAFTKKMNMLGIQILGSGFQFSKRVESMNPQPFLLTALSDIWRDLQSKTEVIVVLLDDVQHFSPISGIFTILKNVLSDEEIVKKTKFLFILSCTPAEWMQFLRKHHPIGRYFTPRLSLKQLSKEETLRVINEILLDSGVTFNPVIKERVFEYTGGHPYELQLLCSNLYDNQIGGKVTEEVWKVSLQETLNSLGEILFDSLYEEASPKERELLCIMARYIKPLSSKEVTSKLRKHMPEFPFSNTGTYLNRLVSKGLLKKRGRGIFSLPDRMFKEYILNG